jgi:hypothetical protein
VGGPFDAVWHEVFGFEASVEALMSPAHVALALGMGLMTSGPLRAGLRRAPGPWLHELPLVLSLTFVVSVLAFFTQIAHPLANLWAAGPARGSHDATELGLVSLMLTTVILTAPILLLLRHGRLPAGGLTILIGPSSVAMGFVFDRGDYPVAAVAALVTGAVAGDLVRSPLRPGPARPGAFRVFACAVPALLHVAYFAALGATRGIAWTPHLWLGAIVFAGVAGWLLSYLALPPRLLPGAAVRT